MISRERLRQLLLFGFVGGTGILVNTFFLWIIHSKVQLPISLASALATEISIITNFVGNHHLTFRNSRNPSPWWQKFLKFQGVSMAALIVTVSVLTLLVYVFGAEYYLFWNLCAIGVAFLINFTLNLKYTWADPTSKL